MNIRDCNGNQQLWMKEWETCSQANIETLYSDYLDKVLVASGDTMFNVIVISWTMEMDASLDYTMHMGI